MWRLASRASGFPSWKKIVFLNESFKRTNRDRFPAFKNGLGAQVNMENRNVRSVRITRKVILEITKGFNLSITDELTQIKWHMSLYNGVIEKNKI